MFSHIHRVIRRKQLHDLHEYIQNREAKLEGVGEITVITLFRAFLNFLEGHSKGEEMSEREERRMRPSEDTRLSIQELSTMSLRIYILYLFILKSILPFYLPSSFLPLVHSNEGGIQSQFEDDASVNIPYGPISGKGENCVRM